MGGPDRGEESGNGTVGKGSWNGGVTPPKSPLPRRITTLLPLPK